MKIKKIALCLIILMPYFEPMAQDIHFSQFAMSPLLLNPALAGMSQGNYRVYTNFRTQWNTIAGGAAYRTLAGGADMAIGKTTKYSSYAGIGVSFFSDHAGAAGFQTDRVSATLAYHIVMNRERNMSLSLGLQGSVNHAGFDPGKATYDFNYDPTTGTVNTVQKESYTRSSLFYGDVGAGVFYNASLRCGTDLYSGAGLSHINQPSVNFDPGGHSTLYEKLYMKLTLHGGASIRFKKQFWLVPNYFVMLQGSSRQYNIGMMTKMHTGNQVLSKTYLYFGVQLRIAHALAIPMADAVIIHSRIDYRRLTIGLSYDINVSSLTSSTSTFGAPEVSITYIITSKFKPKPGYCPVML
jgi:type IX secretion system PorP/SprF family membrane protein